MSAPNWDSLSVQLSRFLGDKVASASTDGSIWSSAQRDNILNMACRDWIRIRLNRLMQFEAKNLIPLADREALAGYITEDSHALSNNTIALSTYSGGVDHIFTAYNVTQDQVVDPIPDQELRYYNPSAGTFIGSSKSNQYYHFDGSNFRLLDASTTTNDTIKLTYLKRHTALVAGGTASTVVSDTAWTATGTAITNFTGSALTYVGGTFVGLDNGGNAFSRTVVAYVSATAFTIDSALVADGAGTNGYLIPPGIATDILIASPYWGELLKWATALGLRDEPTQERIARADALEAQFLKLMGV